MDLVPEHRRASVSGLTQTLNGVGSTAGPSVGGYFWNLTKPNAVVSWGIAALIFFEGFPFYMTLRETNRK